MDYKIDLSRYKTSSDLALDNFKLNKRRLNQNKNINVINTSIDKKKSKIIGKKEGLYISIIFNDIIDSINYNEVLNVLIKELKKIMNKLKIKKDDKCLIIGLGNEILVQDSLGPKVVDKILVTNHIYLLDELNKSYRRVSTFKPGVIGNTGIESFSTVKSLIKTIKPDFIIIIDSLATNTIDKINKVIQITDTGISPGSGIKNYNKELTKESLNVPVICIGIPTTLTITGLIHEITNEMYNINIDNETLDTIYQKLTLNNLTIIPSDIDYFINKFSNLIAQSLNIVLHN